MLGLRTSAKQCSHAEVYGRHGELFSFLMKKESNDPAVSATYVLYEFMRVEQQSTSWLQGWARSSQRSGVVVRLDEDAMPGLKLQH